MYQAVAPCAASRGNRLLALTPSPPLASTPLSSSPPAFSQVVETLQPVGLCLGPSLAQRRSRPSYWLGEGKEEAVCSFSQLRTSPLYRPVSVEEKESERERERERERESNRERERERERG